VLAALLAAEGVTVVDMGGLLSAHLVIGLVLIPVVVLKLASTGYRFARYHTHARAPTATKGRRCWRCDCSRPSWSRARSESSPAAS
jgi:hypothetical protein